MKRILCIFLCLITVLTSLCSCGTPDIEEIRGRMEELIGESYGVNVLLFGEGPETYERVYDPKASMQYFEADGGQRYYYYYIDDAEYGKILAYRTKAYGDDYEYLLVKNEADSTKKSVYEGDGKYYYSLENYYSIEYTPVEREFYYDDTFPADYDVVRIGEEYSSINAIKEYAATVYSADYLNSLYETLFTGIMVSGDTEYGLLTARYIEFESEGGQVWFMKSNKYEALSTEKRIFDTSTAKVLRGSSSTRVRVEMESYLESKPDQKEKVTLSLVKQDGEWFLDSGTY